MTDLAEGGELSGGSEEAEQPKKKWKNYNKAARERSEFATLVSTLIVLGLTVWTVPEEIKPNKDEIDGVTTHLTAIVLRHIDVSMSADVIDIVGILAVSAAYITRVGPELKRLRGGGDNPPGRQPPDRPTPPPSDNGTEQPIVIRTPLGSQSREWLDRLANGGT